MKSTFNFKFLDEAQKLDQDSKLRLAGERWQSLTQQSRNWWNLQAKNPKTEKGMDEKEKRKLIAKHKHHLCEEVQ